MTKPRLDQGPDYERGFIDGMQHQMQSSVDKAVNRMAQPEQEPVAWRWKERINNDFDSWVISDSEPPPYAIEQQPLYTAPPQRKPLSDEEIAVIAAASGGLASDFVVSVARAIEAAHGIKGEA